MKTFPPPTKMRAALMVAALMALGATTAMAAAPAIQGWLDTRALTPSDIKDYALTNAQGASGLPTVGIHQPAYLEADVNISLPNSNIVSVTWALTSKPVGSSAVITNSPLGANVPVYKPTDRLLYKAASRSMLIPDVTGQYTVTATITTTASGTTNVSKTITAGTYMGVNTCALCHSGGQIAFNIVDPWSHTPHADKLTREIDGHGSDHFSKNCLSCHTVGYDLNTNAVNGGFDDIATQLGWTFPTVLTNGNWAAMPAELKNLGNIQCENCHGPGSEHAYSLGNTNRISKTFSEGTCSQCHDSKNTHYKAAEWANSRHAVSTRVPSGPSRAACARCHTSGGFAQYTDALNAGVPYTTNNANTVYESITCQTCHDPHDAKNPHQLRAGPNVLLADGVTTVTNAGAGGFCMNCHRSRNGSVTNSIEKYPLIQQTWAGGSAFGPHDNPASDMLEGVNGWTYGKIIPSSAHALSVSNTCVGCHMQTVATTDPAFLQAGGHTFSMTYTNTLGATVDKVDVCIKCHGSMSSFDMVKVDYDGDGVIQGVQTEVQHLLDKVTTLLPNSTYVASGNYVADGLVKSPSVKTNWPSRFLKAAYNWQFVNNDLSKGVHNAAYAVGLLKASIGDLTGDSNTDGLPDWWQTQYFGSSSSASAAPNASPAGDGIPNWLKYALGLNPMTPGIHLPDGVIWANGGPTTGGTNTIQIYTAAEVVFNTEVGKTYQLQSISTLGGGWQNVGSPIPGDGNSMSLLTPTRLNKQQFYRVSHTP